LNNLSIYIIKVAVYLIAFYLVYSLMLSRDTSLNRNRTFILLSLVSALIFPFLTFQTVKPLNIQFFGKLLSEVFITASASPKEPEIIKIWSSVTSPLQIVYSIYIIGVIVFVFRLLIDLLNLMFLIARHKNEASRIIRFHGFNTAGFSAMGHIFINSRLSPEEAGEITKHEQNHLKLHHFIDIIFIETIKSFQWFNPVVYMFDRSLRAIHEYQADRGCLSSGIPVVNYQSLLLCQVFETNNFNLTNSFSNPSLIKKRMIMMTKKRTSALASMKLLFVVPVVGFVFLSVSAFKENNDPSKIQTVIISNQLQSTSEPSSEKIVPPSPLLPSDSKVENIKESEEVPYVNVDEMPIFPGGVGELLKYTAEHINYPEVAKENKIQGKVIVRFCVTAKGHISQVNILKGVSSELDNEAMRVIKTLPSFKPGKNGGKPVPVWYMLPITFSLK
jgi:TonB family protein